MTIVYAVSSGSYSDYGINAVFSTEEKAQEYIDSMSNTGYYHRSDYGIEEWGLDPTCIKPREGYSWYSVQLYIKTGDVFRVGLLSHQAGWSNEPQDKFIEKFTVDQITRHHSNDEAGHIMVNGKQQLASIYGCNVEARDEKHAIKIANERRTGYILSHPYGKDFADGLKFYPGEYDITTGEKVELRGCRHETQTPHSCPYQADVNNDPSIVCTCCDACQQNCADDI